MLRTLTQVASRRTPSAPATRRTIHLSASAMAAPWFDSVLGPKLLTKADGGAPVAKPTGEVLAGKKFVALYFSAHWCGPCRKFTPMLSVTYEDRADPNEIEVVFVSSDSDMDGFNEYYADMPWPSMPFEERSAAENAGAKFGVEGIPCLVVLDAATGKLITKDGRGKVVAAKKLCGVF